MTRRLIWSVLADNEVDQAAAHISRSNPAAGLRFYAAVEKTCQQIAELAESGSPWDSPNPILAGLRFWPVRRFRNYLIFYRLMDNAVEIVHVLHGARDLETILQQ